MKIDRYKMHPRFDAVELVIDPDGSVCYTRDVAKLEAKCAELEAINAELLEALRLLLAECEHQAWIGNMPDDRVEFGIARAAIAKAKGEAP